MLPKLIVRILAFRRCVASAVVVLSVRQFDETDYMQILLFHVFLLLHDTNKHICLHLIPTIGFPLNGKHDRSLHNTRFRHITCSISVRHASHVNRFVTSKFYSPRMWEGGAVQTTRESLEILCSQTPCDQCFALCSRPAFGGNLVV